MGCSRLSPPETPTVPSSTTPGTSQHTWQSPSLAAARFLSVDWSDWPCLHTGLADARLHTCAFSLRRHPLGTLLLSVTAVTRTRRAGRRRQIRLAVTMATGVALADFYSADVRKLDLLAECEWTQSDWGFCFRAVTLHTTGDALTSPHKQLQLLPIPHGRSTFYSVFNLS